MNNLILNPAPFNNDDSSENNKNNYNKNNKNHKRLPSSNKTIKNKDNEREERNRKIHKLLNENNLKINNSDRDSDDEDDNYLADFNPPSYPEIQEPKKIVKENMWDLAEEGRNIRQSLDGQDELITKEGFKQIPSNNLQQYYEKYNAYLNDSKNEYSNSNMNVSNQELLKKIDNILFLLEEQRETRTNYVTEELILYIFLGIFVIYLADSFVKVGKYIR